MRKNGFTLIELLIVVAIFFVLFTAVMAVFSNGEGNSTPPATAPNGAGSPVAETLIVNVGGVQIVSYGHGVWLLTDNTTSGVGDEGFATALAQFRREHPTEEILSVNTMRRWSEAKKVWSLLVVTREQ